MPEMQMRTEGPVKTRREGAILEVTLDAPKANAIDLKTSRVMGLSSATSAMTTPCASASCAPRARNSSAPAGT
jgi:hypothetical protein